MPSASRRVEWEQRVAAWNASGLTQKQYCAREGIGVSGLRYWASRSHREGKKLTLVPVRVLGGSSEGVNWGSDAIPDVGIKAVGTFTGRCNVDKNAAVTTSIHVTFMAALKN